MSKNLWGLGIACLSLLIMLLFREYANFIYEMDIYNSKLLDMKLITVDDYTCSGWISKSVWKSHNQMYEDHNPTMTFMRHLWKEIEKQLQAYAEEENTEEDSKEICKIADIEFIFDNSSIMALL